MPYESEYEKSLEPVKVAADNNFPDFLFNPVYNEFGDNYYQIGISSDPLVIKARSLRRKYSNYFDYVQAMEVYNDYMELLSEKYGGKSIIKNTLKARRKAEYSNNYDEVEAYETLFDDIIPDKPELKNKKKNREFLRAGVMLSNQTEGESLPEESIKESAEDLFGNPSGINIDEMDIFNKPPKRIRKSLERASCKIAAKQRKENLFSKFGNNSGADFIVEYMNNASKGYYDNKGTYKERSLKEIVKEEERRLSMPPELYEDEMTADISTISSFGSSSNRMVKKSELAQIEIAKELYSIGIDVTGNMSKNMDKKAVKAVRRFIGVEENFPMSKKELKNLKKQQKKENRRLNEQQDNDRLLRDTLLKNKFSFDKNGSSLNFRLRDTMHDD